MDNKHLKKSRIFVVVGNVYFSVETMEHFEKIVLKKGTAICTNKCEYKPVCLTISLILTKYILFGHIARASQEHDCRGALLAQ